jgi:hypothetical protein
MARSIYPSIPAPGNDLPSIQASLGAMRQSLNMLILNAQNPNPNFAPSSAAQVFVTHDQLKKLNLIGEAGPQGSKGDQGLPGPAGPPGAPGGGGATPSSTLPAMDGTAAVGTSTTYARGDHVHPSDTSVPVFDTLPLNAVDDTAAAAAGVPVGGVYRNGSQLMVRII